ncbi:MAG TPA: efflux RND transporter periplasmic adaptor subunit, partial [Phycisphaerales bacterium]|nr:efflux RND transporter periplasmic adaptor subunit [Phycisphaerales bacterium]
MRRQNCWTLLVLLSLGSGACERHAAAPTPAPAEAPAAPTNRVDIGPAVRQSLGLTFATVESRAVSRTLRIPGRFELLPSARREYRVAAAGVVELLVQQYQLVEPGTPLFRLDSPRWREIQRELTDAEAGLAMAQAAVDSVAPFAEAHERHHAELQVAVDLWVERVAALERLKAAGGARGDEVSAAQGALAAARAALAETFEKEADLTARGRDARAQLEAARSRMALLLQTASSMTGEPAERLAEAAPGVGARWKLIGRIEVRALAPGVIDSVSAVSGGLVDAGGLVITTVEPQRVRFRAHALQSDLGRLSEGAAASVVAPTGGSLASAAPVRGVVTLAPTADPERRTIEVVLTPLDAAPTAAWARAGVAAFLEVMTSGSGRQELAIPLACVA